MGETVVFTGTAESNRPLTYTWDFGDGGTGSGAVVTHTYAADGDYLVELEAANVCGAEVVTATVSVCQPVAEADFDWTPITPTVDEWIVFQSTAEGSSPITYTWEFGDGGTAEGITATHVYALPGAYRVTLTATNCAGPVAVVHTLTVALPCTAVEIVKVTPKVAGCAVTLTTELTGTAPFTYLWAFGDGITSTLVAPVHTYAQTGGYSATLDVWNCADTGHDTSAFTVQVDCPVPPTWSVYLPVVFK
jgi:PKD repeat protein